MAEYFPFGMNSLSTRCGNLSRDIQDWGIVCSDVTERANLLVSAEINNLTYPLCRRKQEESCNFLRVVVNHRQAIEVIFQHSVDLKRMLMQHRNNVLLKKILIDEISLLDMVRNLSASEISLKQYDNKLKLHEISLYL
ncbi:hypothetical protein CEXT_446621 [Caerostris extrusa]|uniref:Uncharacterized protein n=1 Tax=Caerostris extrusa TaxID=172846 RepID=A0AAV4SXY6_CAEEX|nr:hypothetical protein CEXT_446621 [Caerostris extrusa]